MTPQMKISSIKDCLLAMRDWQIDFCHVNIIIVRVKLMLFLVILSIFHIVHHFKKDFPHKQHWVYEDVTDKNPLAGILYYIPIILYHSVRSASENFHSNRDRVNPRCTVTQFVVICLFSFIR